MKIALFHPAIVPPKEYGGVERLVYWLAKGLVELGHDVHLAALEGSQAPKGAKLIPMTQGQVTAHHLLPKLPKGLDGVHFMVTPEDGVWEKLPGFGLVTVHGNGQIGEKFHRNTVFLCKNHANRHQAEAFVYCGLDPDEYEFRSKKDDYFLFLSKTSWSVKNVRGALRYCRRAQVPLRIAGGSRPISTRLLSAVLPGARWIGPVNQRQKAKVLAPARALIFPIRWPEPFGVVMPEALVSGTPVIASKRGSTPEVITEDVGVLLEGEDEDRWVEEIQHFVTKSWDPEVCRKRVIERFHYRRMADDYAKIYSRLSKGEYLNPSEPVAGDWKSET